MLFGEQVMAPRHLRVHILLLISSITSRLKVQLSKSDGKWQSWVSLFPPAVSIAGHVEEPGNRRAIEDGDD